MMTNAPLCRLLQQHWRAAEEEREQKQCRGPNKRKPVRAHVMTYMETKPPQLMSLRPILIVFATLLTRKQERRRTEICLIVMMALLYLGKESIGSGSEDVFLRLLHKRPRCLKLNGLWGNNRVFLLNMAKPLLVNFKNKPAFEVCSILTTFVAASHKSDFTYCDVRLTLIKEQTRECCMARFPQFVA